MNWNQDRFYQGEATNYYAQLTTLVDNALANKYNRYTVVHLIKVPHKTNELQL